MPAGTRKTFLFDSRPAQKKSSPLSLQYSTFQNSPPACIFEQPYTHALRTKDVQTFEFTPIGRSSLFFHLKFCEPCEQKITFTMRRILPLSLLTFLLITTSCADYKLHIEGEPMRKPPAELGEPEHIMYLIGDAGDAELGEVPPAVKYLGKKLKDAPEYSSVMFLGDNIYPAGLPPRKSKGRELAEHRIRMQLDILEGYKGRPFFIPGNHDWYQPKRRKGVERVEEFVEEYLDQGKDVWLPDDGCSGPVTEDLSKNVVGMFVDSEWYLMNWNSERELNEGCDIKSREAFAFFVQDEMKKNRRKNIVVVMHHPIHTNGPHGGRYSWRQHIFPLTDVVDNLYLPLPGLGTAFQILRATAGSREDTSHPRARELKAIMESSAGKNGSFIFVSGHEHNLQYFEVEEQSFIVSGSGSKTNPAGKGRGAQFAYGGEPGFSILKFYPEGEVFLEFWTANPGGEDGKLVFSRQIKGKLPTYESDIPTEFPEYEEGRDSVTLALKTDVKNSNSHRFFWGDHYRKAYMAPVKVPALDLEVWRGGVTPLKRGGGSQTNSLRVEDPQGHQWVLRSMLKDETRMVPYPFNKTFAKDVFADQFTSANPYIAFVIPKMADAVGVYHTNPKLYYIAKQPRLGDFNDLYGGGLYLVEERADDDWHDLASFGNSKNLISSTDLLDKKEKNHNHRIDGPSVVRHRLFDNLIGDWDRHDDNWRWAAFKNKEKDITIYRPIPRDRDQPFAKYDGLVPGIIRLSIPFLKQLRVYGPDIPNIKWVNYHSKYFDPTFLSEPSWSTWEREAKQIQQNLTNEVIDEALSDFPPEIKAIDGQWIAERLKGRRANLMDIARDFYLLMSKKVDVVGTDKHDFFLVERLDDEKTRVRAYASGKDGDKEEVFYDRTFLTSETKEVRLYGLDQEDHFHITGEVNTGILVRCTGGLDDDTFIDESKVAGIGKKTKFYDTKGGNHLETGTEARDKTSNDPVLNTYDRRSWDTEHNWGMGYPFLAGNPDDGIAVGGGAIFTRYGFKKSPFAARHTLGATYAIETKAFDFKYGGEFIHALNHWDVLLDAKLQGPTYTRNFFGFGNESTNWLRDDKEKVEDFVRVRQELYGIYPSLRRLLGNNLSFSFGGTAEAVKIDNDLQRLVNTSNAEVRAGVFENLYFGGGEFQLNYFNADNPDNPTMGITLNATLGQKVNLEDTDRSFTYYAGHFGLYLGGPKLVLASKVGAKHVAGEFEFYQAATLGARENLRGYRYERFTGQTAFYHQNDVRLRLFNVGNYILPFTLGVLAGYDYGRVWMDDEDSDAWHDSYGGGIWLSPFDLTVLTFSYFQSDDGPRFQFKGGFAF
jgi:Omp85 superfamily domain/Calcineurin-like phosphoesterase